MSVRWTEQDLQTVLARHADNSTSAPFHLPANEANAFARGRVAPGRMNKLESAYDAHLWSLHREGQILWHKFEAIKLRLADNTHYTPDFFILPASGILECHETKGFWRDDARVKTKVAAAMYPFRFIAVSKTKGGGWEREEFS